MEFEQINNIKPSPKPYFFILWFNIIWVRQAATHYIKFWSYTLDVFAESSKKFDISVSLTTFFVSISILILWIPLKQKIGIGTISNAIIAFTIDLFVYLLPHSTNILSIFQMMIGILLVGLEVVFI